MRLTLEPRNNNQLDGFADDDTPHQISELEKKLSKRQGEHHWLGRKENALLFCHSKLIWQNDHTLRIWHLLLWQGCSLEM